MKNMSAILDTYYGINLSKKKGWYKLSDKITAIYLDQEANIYTDPDELYYFDTANNLLLISKNYGYHSLKEEDISTEKGSYKPYIYVDMDKISGFVATCVLGPYGTMIERPF